MYITIRLKLFLILLIQQIKEQLQVSTETLTTQRHFKDGTTKTRTTTYDIYLII